MDNNPLDIGAKNGYNVAKDDLNEFVDLVAMPPINDTECRHETLVAEPEDTIGDAVYHGCVNPKCGVGFYIRPHVNAIKRQK